jgi:hypothetical protein
LPGGIEEFFAAQGAYFAQLQGPPDPERLAAIWAGHGRIVGPPIALDAVHEAVRGSMQSQVSPLHPLPCWRH